MSLIKQTFIKFLRFFDDKNSEDAPSFFDYPAEEKKKIINKAAKEANKMQRELVDKYGGFSDENSMIKAYATK